MKRFKYDVVKLIEAVRDRPCLWNKHIENYKDRVERKLAWIEIFNILDERYDEMTSDDKRLTSEKILSKWTNVRDTFVKSLRSKAGRTKKQYVLYEHLKFLLEVVPDASQQEQDNLGYITDEQPVFMRDVTQGKESASFRMPLDYEISYDDSNDSSETEPVPVQRESSGKRKRSKKESHTEEPTEEASNIDFVSIDDPRIMNEDEAFFASLLPTVVKYDEDERLEFRIEVLAVMKRIKDRRKWSSDVKA